MKYDEDRMNNDEHMMKYDYHMMKHDEHMMNNEETMMNNGETMMNNDEHMIYNDEHMMNNDETIMHSDKHIMNNDEHMIYNDEHMMVNMVPHRSWRLHRRHWCRPAGEPAWGQRGGSRRWKDLGRQGLRSVLGERMNKNWVVGASGKQHFREGSILYHDVLMCTIYIYMNLDYKS